MKNLYRLLLSASLLFGLTSCRHAAPVPQGTRVLERDEYLGLLVQIEKELAAAGQTNLASQVDTMVRGMLLDQCTYELHNQVGILRWLREGNTNLVEFLEIDLDSQITNLAMFGQLGPDQLKELKRARLYRTKYPRKTDRPKTDAEVARMLDLVNEK